MRFFSNMTSANRQNGAFNFYAVSILDITRIFRLERVFLESKINKTTDIKTLMFMTKHNKELHVP